MPDIDFPVNPSLNATYSKDGKTWIWDGSRWRTNNILSYSGGGTGYASYTTGDLLVGTGNSILKFPVGQNNFQYLRVDSVNSASGVTWISLPLAGVGQSGLVSNLNQTFEGVKTFSSSIIGNLTGTATTSENVNVTTTTRSLTHYLTFTNQSSGSGLALTTSTIGIGFTVNPAQNTLAAGTFVGNLSGTAVTAGILKVTSTSGTALNIADRVTVYTVDNFEGLNINSNYSYALSVQDKSNNNRFIVDVSNSRTIFTGSSADHELRIYNSNQSAYAGFKANSTGTITYILPPGKPSTGSSILQSDDSGNMIWVPMTSGLSSAITSINSQTGPSITLQTGSSGNNFAISQSANIITFDIPDASGSNRGLVTTGSQTFAGTKTFSSTISGNLSGTATTSQNVNTAAFTNNSVHYLTFTLVGNGAGAALSTSNVAGKLTYRPADEQLSVPFITGTAFTATNFYGSLSGNVTGTATTSQNVNTNVYTNNSVHYLTFTLIGSGAGAALSTSNVAGKLTYRPADEQLSVTNITGTAFTATNFYGTHVGNVTGTATTSQNVNTAAFTNNNVHYLTFTLVGNGAGAALSTSNVAGKLTYRPADEQLSVPFITGTAFTATNLTGTLAGNVTGTATTSQNVNTNVYTNNSVHYLTFTLQGNGAGAALSTSNSPGKLTYRPADEQLSVTNITGTAFTATNFYGALTGNVTGTATTSRNVNTNVYTNNSVHYLTFTLQGNGAGAALSTSNSAGKLTYRPADDQLSVANITGTAFTATNFYGSVTGTATTSQNINVNTTTRNANHFLLFSNTSVGSGVALTTSTIGIGFTVNPAENTLSAGLFAGNISGTGATFARATFTNDTEATDATTGSVTFAGGIAVAKKVFSESIQTSGNALFAGNLQVQGGLIQLGNSGAADTIGFICKIQSVMLPQANNTFDIGLNDGTHAWKNAAFAGHGTFANLYGSTSANLTGVQFSGGDVLIRSGKSVKFYEANDVYNTSIKANSSITTNYTYTLPLATPGSGGSILQSDTSGNMLWVKAASNKATYVLSFGAGFTPTTGLDSVSLAIPYANDGSTSLTYTIKRVEVRTETEPGASTLAFYFERHTTGNAIWTVTPITIKGAASANFSVAQNNYVSSFTTITSSSGNNGEVASGNYLRVNFASVGTAANVSISIMIQEN